MRRRISVMRSAIGEGWSPSLSSRARTKWSIGLRTQAAFLTEGRESFRMGWKAQCRERMGVEVGDSWSVGQGRPSSTQRRRAATSRASSGSPSRGIFSSPRCSTAWMSRL